MVQPDRSNRFPPRVVRASRDDGERTARSPATTRLAAGEHERSAVDRAVSAPLERRARLTCLFGEAALPLHRPADRARSSEREDHAVLCSLTDYQMTSNPDAIWRDDWRS